MSRLYVTHETDYKSGNGHCATTKACAAIYWGSSSQSKLAARIVVHWPKGASVPSVSVYSLPNEDDTAINVNTKGVSAI